MIVRFIAALCALGAHVSAATQVVELANYPVDPSGAADSTVAIQTAIDDLAAHGGGELHIPRGTYLLDTWYPTEHPWFFRNLLLGSHASLVAEPGTRFVQGPNGRHALITGAYAVRNTVVAVGATFVSITFQNGSRNGGFMDLGATTAGSPFATLATPADAGRFAVGDRFALYETTTGDVNPGETGRVVAISGATLQFERPLARSFSTPSIANVTALATVDVSLSGLSIQGAEPFSATETFDLTVRDCSFISDLAAPAGNLFANPDCNTIRHGEFTRCLFTSVGPGHTYFELPQRDSQDILFAEDRFEGTSVGFGEYGAHWIIRDCDMMIYADAPSDVGVDLGGYDVLFTRNRIHGVAGTGTGGFQTFITDLNGPVEYIPYVGRVRMIDNTADCQAPCNDLVHLACADPLVAGNRFTAGDGVVGLKAESNIPMHADIEDNVFSLGTSIGVVLATPSPDDSMVIGNTITGRGDFGIYVADATPAHAGGHLIEANRISGYTTPIRVTAADHPGTLVSVWIDPPTAAASAPAESDGAGGGHCGVGSVGCILAALLVFTRTRARCG